MTIIGKGKTFWLRLYSKFYYLQVVFAALSSCIISNYFAYNFRMKVYAQRFGSARFRKSVETWV